MNGCWILLLLLFCGCNNGLGGCGNGGCGGNCGGGRPGGSRVMGERMRGLDREFDCDRRDCDDDRRTFPGINSRNDTCGCEEE